MDSNRLSTLIILSLLNFLLIKCDDVNLNNKITQLLENSTCPGLDNGDNYTQSEFTKRLTHDCRYDKLLRPVSTSPLNVFTQLYVYHVESTSGHDPQFKVQMLLQLRYTDDRLEYKTHSPNRTQIIGESRLHEKIWIPHIFITNEKSSRVMGTDEKNVLIRIAPDGEVIYSSRVSASLYCWMNLHKFPFDEQKCFINFESWTYDIRELRLQWEHVSPVIVQKQLHLTEFTLMKYWVNVSQVDATTPNSQHGAFYGNYSRITFTMHMKREIGYYVLDYFIPSIMIVAMSWVTFWIQADNTAPRVTLGTSTLLSFITLAGSQTKDLPRVSYIKTSEVWFLACTAFIFGSMVEFAFVNTIWRQKQNIELRKVNSKHILKSTLTPKLHRKELQKVGKSSSSLHKSHSCSSLQNDLSTSSGFNNYNNYLTVQNYSSIPVIKTQSDDDLMSDTNTKDSCVTISMDHETKKSSEENRSYRFTGWTTMTPQEISAWIDQRSKIAFPVAFFIFNMFFWSMVYAF